MDFGVAFVALEGLPGPGFKIQELCLFCWYYVLNPQSHLRSRCNSKHIGNAIIVVLLRIVCPLFELTLSVSLLLSLSGSVSAYEYV